MFDRRQERDTDIFFEALNSPDEAQEHLERVIEEDRTWGLLQLEFLFYAAREPEAWEKLAERFRTWHAEFTELLERWLAEMDYKLELPAGHLSWLISAVGNGLGLQALPDPEAMPRGIYAAALERSLSDASGQTLYGGSR